MAVDLLGEFRLVPAEVLAVSPFVRTLGPLSTGSGLAGALLGLTLVVSLLAGFGLGGLRRRDLG